MEIFEAELKTLSMDSIFHTLTTLSLTLHVSISETKKCSEWWCVSEILHQKSKMVTKISKIMSKKEILVKI